MGRMLIALDVSWVPFGLKKGGCRCGYDAGTSGWVGDCRLRWMYARLSRGRSIRFVWCFGDTVSAEAMNKRCDS